MNIGVSEKTFVKKVREEMGLEVYFKDFDKFRGLLFKTIRKSVLEGLSKDPKENNVFLKESGLSLINLETIFVYTYEANIDSKFIKRLILSEEFKDLIVFKDPKQRVIKPVTKKRAIKLFLLREAIEALVGYSAELVGERHRLRITDMAVLSVANDRNLPMGELVTKRAFPTQKYKNVSHIDVGDFISEFELEPFKKEVEEVLLQYLNDSYWLYFEVTHRLQKKTEEIQEMFISWTKGYFQNRS